MIGEVELGAGTGVVGAFGAAVLFVPDGEAAASLVEVVRDVAGPGGPVGRVLARRLGALVTGGDADRLPAFGVLAAIDDGWVVVLHGAVAAAIATDDGGEELVTGTSASTWTDRLVSATADAVLLGPVGLARPGASALRLERGVVPGGWLRVELGHGPRTLPSAPVFERFSLVADAVETRPPLPIEGVPLPEPGPGPVGLAPPLGPPVEVAEQVAVLPHPSLGLLVFDDGAAFGLDTDYVLGREPEADDAVMAGRARPIALDDPADTVSRVHAAIHLAAPDVQLIDRGSTNGTHLWDAANGLWERLAPGEPRVIRPGERGAVGRRTFVVEAPTETSAPAPRAPQTVAVARPVGSLVRDDGAAYPLDRSYVIGREPLSDDGVRRATASPIVVRDDQISRVHAHVTVTGATVSVRDAGTPGGTFIAAPGAAEWESVGDEPTQLAPGWSLRVGAHVFTFRDER